MRLHRCRQFGDMIVEGVFARQGAHAVGRFQPGAGSRAQQVIDHGWGGPLGAVRVLMRHRAFLQSTEGGLEAVAHSGAHSLQRQGGPRFAEHRQRIGQLGQRRRGIDQQQRAQTREPAVILPKLQGTQAMLLEIAPAGFADAHAPFGFVGQQGCDRIGHHGPGRKYQRLGQRRPGSRLAVIGHGGGYPEVLFQVLAEDVVHDRAHTAVGRVQRRIGVDGVVIEHGRSSRLDCSAEHGRRRVDLVFQQPLQAVVAHEVEQIGRRLPVFDDLRRIERARHLRNGGCLREVGGRDRDRDGRLAHHGVALDRGCDPLGSGDHTAQAPFDGLAGLDR